MNVLAISTWTRPLPLRRERKWYSLRLCRKGPKVVFVDGQPLHEIEKLFRDVEEKRETTFQSTLREIQFDFLRAESQRASYEKQRDKEFKNAQFSREELFHANEKRRYELFMTAEQEQDRIFQTSEDRRNTTFAQSQAVLRQRLEEMSQHHSKENDYTLGVIGSLLSSGYARREGAFKQLNDTTTGAFITLLRSEQDVFFEAQVTRMSEITPVKLSVRKRPHLFLCIGQEC